MEVLGGFRGTWVHGGCIAHGLTGFVSSLSVLIRSLPACQSSTCINPVWFLPVLNRSKLPTVPGYLGTSRLCALAEFKAWGGPSSPPTSAGAGLGGARASQAGQNPQQGADIGEHTTSPHLGLLGCRCRSIDESYFVSTFLSLSKQVIYRPSGRTSYCFAAAACSACYGTLGRLERLT